VPNPYHVRLAVSQYGDQFRAELFTEDLGDTEGDLLPARWDVLDEWLPYLAQGAAGLPPDAARQVGKQLFAYLLGKAENSKKWAAILEQARRQGRPLRLLIDATTAAVRDLPYGLLCEQHDDYYLFRPGPGHETIRFVRILRRCTPRSLRLRQPARILLAVAEPQGADVPEFDAARCLCQLARGLAARYDVFLCSAEGARAVAEAVPGPAEQWAPEQLRPFVRTTPGGLRAVLASGDFDILHLVAHGTAAGVLLCGPDGGPAELTRTDLAGWCGASRLQMAFLQVCRASRTGEGGSLGGLAQQLISPNAGNLAAVVASTFPLDSEHSTEAALAFYDKLAQGSDPDAALERGLLESNWSWAFLELWVRPSALGGTGARGAFQFVCPYRGLARFQERHADLFFGRDAEVAELLGILEQEVVVAVVGDSGSGKSSLLQAGLVPALRRRGIGGRTGWRILSVRPGYHPTRSLLVALLLGEDGLLELPTPASWASALRALLEQDLGSGKPVLILFDQFEEVFTLCPDEAQGRYVARVLHDIASRWRNDFRLVLGLRGEFLGAAAALPGLGQHLKRPWVLRPPLPDELATIVARPAEASGYTFEGALADDNPRHWQGLLERILQDPLLTQRSGDGEAAAIPRVAPLPLLEFALERLWLKAVERGARAFCHADLDGIGGLGGAIAQHAEDVYSSLPTHAELGPEGQRLAERLILGLVSARRTRRPRPRAELEHEAGPAEAARRVLDHLVGERLLTVRSDRDNLAEAQVDLAHEVLIDRWERLAGWLAQDPEGRALREAFQSDAAKWDAGMPGIPPRSGKLLPGPDTAAGYLTWIGKSKPLLTEVQTAFATALRIRRRRRRSLVVLGCASTAVVAVAMTALAVYAWSEKRQAEISQQETLSEKRQAEISQQETLSQLARNHLERGVSLCATNHTTEGLLHLLRGYETARNDDPLRRRARSLLGGWSGALGMCLAHEGTVRGVAFSPDGQTVLTGSADGRAQLWDVATGQPRGQPLWHDDTVYAVAFSPDGKTVLTGSEDKTARRWDAATGAPLGPPLRHEGRVYAVAFSPDGKTVLTGSDDKTARRWDAATGAPLGPPLRHDDAVSAVAFSPDGKTVLTGSDDKTARRWDTATGAPLGPPLRHDDAVSAVAFSPDGKWMLTGSEDKTARRWDAATGLQEGQPLQHQGTVLAVAFSSDGRTVITGSEDQTARLWDADTHRPLGQPLRHAGPVPAVAFSPDGATLLTGSEDRTARLWDALPGRQHGQPFCHQKAVYAVAFSRDGKSVLTGSDDKTAQLWDVETGRPRGEPLRHDGTVYAVAFDRDGKTLLTGSGDETARLWDAATGRPRGQPLRHDGRVFAVAFSPDGETALTGSEDYTARLWDAATGRPRGQPLRHGGGVFAVAFSPDGQTMVIGDWTGIARRWDAATGEPRGQPFRHGSRVYAVAFSPDGQAVLTGGYDGSARLWDAATGRARGQPLRHDQAVNAVAFSPDGQTVLTGSDDGTARLWDVETGWQRGQFLAQRGKVAAVAFSPDGQTVLIGSEGGAAQLWDLPPDLPDDPERLRLWIEVATAQRWDESDSLVTLPYADWLAARQRLDKRGGPPLAVRRGRSGD
jgi:WD40 repeat protein